MTEQTQQTRKFNGKPYQLLRQELKKPPSLQIAAFTWSDRFSRLRWIKENNRYSLWGLLKEDDIDYRDIVNFHTYKP